MSIEPPLDPIRVLIEKMIEDRHLDMSQISLQLGKNVTYIQQYLRRGSPKRLPEDVRERLAGILGVAESSLKPGINPVPKQAPIRVPIPRAKAHSSSRLEVLGMAECGPNGWSLWNGDVIDTIPRPANLIGVPGAYAVYVRGTSMEPRYHPGELAHIHPGKPVDIGDYVLVQKHAEDGDGRPAVIKKLKKRSGNKVTLEQFNPPSTFEIKAEEIFSMHKVVGSSEA